MSLHVSEPSRWWLRSASNNNDNNFNNVNNDGSNWNNNNANNENGVVVGSSLARRSSCMKLMKVIAKNPVRKERRRDRPSRMRKYSL